MGELEISDDKTRLDIDVIHNFLTNSYWAQGRPKEVVQKCIEGSYCLGGYLEDQQVAFLRAVTDKTLFGYVFDVFVLEEYRGRGFAGQLLRALIENPEHQSIRWMLKTKDAQALYQKVGFTALPSSEGLYILQN